MNFTIEGRAGDGAGRTGDFYGRGYSESFFQFSGVGLDTVQDPLKILFITDYVFIIITMPDFVIFIPLDSSDLSGDCGFECACYHAEGRWFHFKRVALTGSGC